MKIQPRRYQYIVILLCLSTLLMSFSTACSLPPGSDATKTLVVPAFQTPVVPVELRMPVTELSCPLNNTARPAVMKNLAPGKTSAIAYMANSSNPDFAQLKVYNTQNQQKLLIAQLPGAHIISAQISANGQWLLFLASSEGRVKLQLIRMDGQGLQTLYCMPVADYTYNRVKEPLVSAQWSPDQSQVLISSFTRSATGTITLLHILTGVLSPMFTHVDGPDNTYYYTVLKWLDTTRAYITRIDLDTPTSPGNLYLLDVSKNVHAQDDVLRRVLQYRRRLSFSSLDSSEDGLRLFSSACLAAKPFDTSLSSDSTDGNGQQLIYHRSPNICIREMRALSASKLLMFMEIYNGSKGNDHQIWTLSVQEHTSAVSTLVDTRGNGYTMNRFTQYLWSNISRDGQFYALGPNHYASAPQQLAFAPLKGGPLTSFESSTTASLDIVGWIDIE